MVNFSSCEYKRLIRDDHFVPIGSYAQGYPLRLGMERKAREFFAALAYFSDLVGRIAAGSRYLQLIDSFYQISSVNVWEVPLTECDVII